MSAKDTTARIGQNEMCAQYTKHQMGKFNPYAMRSSVISLNEIISIVESEWTRRAIMFVFFCVE